MHFEAFDKIGRLKRDMVITEKIDGTNAQVCITPAYSLGAFHEDATNAVIAERDGLVMLAGSRNRYLTPTADNFGFAKWVEAHADELWALGEGRHFGEWWGSGVQRGYGLTNGEKRFSLFNVNRWQSEGNGTPRPACCHVVPVLKRWTFDTPVIDAVLADLAANGSVAAPGFMKPEGIVVFQAATRTLFKRTIDKDDEPKSQAVAS